MTPTTAKRSLDTPDELRTFDHGHLALVTIGDRVLGRAVFEPTWRWSTSVKPIAGTESCEFAHAGYIASGSMRVRMDDGTELDLETGDAFVVGPGHDAWVTSAEPCIMYDDRDYANPPAKAAQSNH